MDNQITIAIDGWSSCGKSTLAKALAKQLNYVYVDSGAMYRGVALHAMNQGWIKGDQLDEKNIINGLKNLSLRFDIGDSGQPELVLNGNNVEQKIRSLAVSNQVSKVAAIKEVRSFLVDQQRKMGQEGGVVMDGRDIGSVVFPNAELKLFVTADPEIRAQRRFDELLKKGDHVSLDAVRENLKQRDHLDTTREVSPLIQTDDAVVLDNSNLTPKEQTEKAMKLVQDKLIV
jgi:cytidylate kinase